MEAIRFHEIAERDHDIQNPTSPDKIRLLGEQLRLGPESRVLDIACGRCGPAIVLASAFGCRIVGVEKSPVFAAAGRDRLRAAGLEQLVAVQEGDGADFPLEAGAWDAALCLGASWVWGGLEGTVAALAPAVRAGGHVAVGEPYWRRWPLPDGIDDEGVVALPETVARFEHCGLRVVGLTAASEDDWDRYEALHWRAVEAWLAEQPEDSAAVEVRDAHERHRARYLEINRDLLGWTILAGVKGPSDVVVSIGRQLRGGR